MKSLPIVKTNKKKRDQDINLAYQNKLMCSSVLKSEKED